MNPLRNLVVLLKADQENFDIFDLTQGTDRISQFVSTCTELFRNFVKDQIINFKEHVEETHRRLDRRFTYYDNPLIDEAREKWRGW